MAEHIKSRWPLAWKETDRMVRRDYNRIFEEHDALLAACESLVANLPDEIFEWIGDSISWSNVSAIKNAREVASAAITLATADE